MLGTARKLAFGSLLRFSNSVATALVALLIMPFVVHTLGDRMYGAWALVASLLGYTGLLELGLSQAILRYISRSLGSEDKNECNRVFNTALWIYSVLGGAALLVTGAMATLAPEFCKSPEDASLFWKVILILGVSLSLQFPVRVFKGVLQANLRYDLMAWLDLLTLTLRTTLVIVVLELGGRLLGLAWVTFLGSLPSAVLTVYLAFKKLPFLRLDLSYWGRATTKTLLSYSAYSFMGHIADILRFQADNVVVGAFLGLSAVTHFSIAGKLDKYFKDLVSAVLYIFPSMFSRLEGAQDIEGIRKVFFLGSRISLCVAGFLAFGIIAWGKPFITRWMGAQYLDAYPVVVVLGLSTFFAVSQTPSVGLVYGTSKHKFYAYMTSAEGLLNLALSLILVQRYGIMGVAVGTMIPMALSKLVVQPIYVSRVSVIGYGEYVKTMGKTLAVVAASLVIPFIITMKFARPDYKVLFAIGALSVALYAVPLWFLGFSAQETRLLREAVLPQWLRRERGRASPVLN